MGCVHFNLMTADDEYGSASSPSSVDMKSALDNTNRTEPSVFSATVGRCRLTPS